MLQEILQSLPQVLIDGLTLGTVYAVIALGYTMVYGILQLINFAHGEIFMSGAFIGTTLLIILTSIGWVSALPAIPKAIRDIFTEELSVYLSGTRSSEETAQIMQSRIQLYLNEQG